MNTTTKKTIAVGASSAIALTGAFGAMVALEPAAFGQDGNSTASQVQQEASTSTDIITMKTVEGTFAYTQDDVASNAYIKKHLTEASMYLCGSSVQAGKASAVEARDWPIEVNGAVDVSFSTTLGEIIDEGKVQTQVMGCSCAGNPADGAATANAEVTGVALAQLLEMASPNAEANTIVFASADGYTIALPLSYVLQHYCPIVFDVNGSDLADSVGGTNQLWLGSTPASYFVRDLASITLEKRVTPPPSPTSDEAREAYAVLPNIGVMYGGEVR